MRDLFDLYRQQFRTTAASMLQYRAALVIWLTWHIMEPLVYLVVWSIVSRTQGSVGGYTARDFAAYFIILMLVNHVTFTWIMFEYEYRVRKGSLSFALLKPVHPIHSDIADNVSFKAITMPAMMMVAAALAVLFRPSFTFMPRDIVLFIPAVVLAFLIRFLLEWTLAQVAFWTTRVSAVNQMYFTVMLFLSGQIAPLGLFPAPVRTISWLLPFRWTVGFPVELLLGRLTLSAALTGLAVQAGWLLVSLVLVRIAWRAGVRVYSAVGA